MLLRRHNGTLNNVAVAYDFSPSSLEMPGLGDTAHVEYLDSFDDCLAAVRAGTVDAYYTYTYQAERTVFDDTRNELRSMLSDEQRNFCIGVRQDYDVLLRTVLNKSIDSLTHAEISTITNAYINLGQQPFSLTRLAYQYPAIIVLTCLCVLVTAVCIALAIRAQRKSPAQGRGSQRCQDGVPVQHVPRHPHAHQRHYGYAGHCRGQL